MTPDACRPVEVTVDGQRDASTERLTPYAELIELLEALPLLVRERRRRCGLSLRATAGQAGVSFSSLARFEHGRGIDLSTAVLLLAWVGEPADVCSRCGGEMPVTVPLDETAVTT